jgi:Ran GTPase-activating protein (RanGAP) involved in mRNA processing and transport
MLKTNRTLNWLGLHANQIGDEGVQLMANALEKNQNTRLEKLHIFSNKWVSDSSVDALVDMITQNQSLTELMVHNCSMSEEGKERLLQANKSRKQPLDLRV